MVWAHTARRANARLQRSMLRLVLPMVYMEAISTMAVCAAADDIDGPEASAVLLGRGNSMVGWTHAWNTPSPGNSLSVSESEVAPWSGLAFFNISYNFTGVITNDEWLTLGTDQGYVNTASGVPLLAVSGTVGVRFAAYNPRPVHTPIVVTVRDSAGKTYGSYPELAPNGTWANYSLSLRNTSIWMPSPTNLSLPLVAITVGPAKGQPAATDIGWMGVADIALMTEYPGTVPVAKPILWQLAQPETTRTTGGVLVARPHSPSVQIGAMLTNRLQHSCDIQAIVESRWASGVMGEGRGGSFDSSWDTCSAVNGHVAGWGTQLLSCTANATEPGFVLVRARLISASCAGLTGPNVTDQIVMETGLAIVSPLPSLSKGPRPNRVHGVFGGQFLQTDDYGMPGPTAASLIGMRTIRT